MAFIRRSELPLEWKTILIASEPLFGSPPIRRTIKIWFKRGDTSIVTGQFRPKRRIELLVRWVGIPGDQLSPSKEEVHVFESEKELAHHVSLIGILPEDVIEDHTQEYPYFQGRLFTKEFVPRPEWLDEKVAGEAP